MPTSTLSAEERELAGQAVDLFVGQFGESYRQLACYAAIPLLLTPELVNYLRNHFLGGQVPWVAEVDLLLSDLCRPVDYELYTIRPVVRAYLLEEMRQKVGPEQMQQVARTLIHYVRHLAQTNAFMEDHELQTQQWAAMVYLDDQRETAVREIAYAFQNAVIPSTDDAQGDRSIADKAEMARLSRITQSLAPELAEYSELVGYAESIGQLLASTDLDTKMQLRYPLKVIGLNLPFPEQIRKKTEVGLDKSILPYLPHFLAVNYQRLLAAQTARERLKSALLIYDLVVRILTISMLSQYLIRDRDYVANPYLNKLLLRKIGHLTLGNWQELLFTTLKTYEGIRDRFLMSELYDFYWDTSTLPHRQRVDVEYPFRRLVQISIELEVSGVQLQDEAGWQQLASEATSLLQEILGTLAFIGMYDLIRVLDYDDQFYDFELHKGLEISTSRLPLPKDAKFDRGSFYWRKQRGEFLSLHPFMVFWEEKIEEGQPALTDVGLYDGLVNGQNQYILAMSGRIITFDALHTRTFVELVYDPIKITRVREPSKLTWWELRDLCAEITRSQTMTIQGRYHPDLYLQRNNTRQEFEQFLRSDKRCFVLIGKSGSGKSNFLLALSEDLQRSRNDACMLVYDGAQLKVELSVTSIITKDFNDRIIPSEGMIQNIWREIAQIEGIGDRLVVLCVDAINENPQAKELLRQLDELGQESWPWLKVVFSSRPESWQSIKRSVRLAEVLYYREAETERLTVELETFSYSEQIEPFSHEELPLAYTKYRQFFKLTTPYEALSLDLREMLRDPVNLWLVASIYERQAIPATLKASELGAQYVNALVRTERLRETDLRLLENQLVPLMVGQGRYRNTITTADIDAAGMELFEAMYAEQPLNSFTNLLDAGILTQQLGVPNPEITFKNQLLYNYFVGRRILRLSLEQSDRVVFFKDLLNRTVSFTYLEGAVKYALTQDIGPHGPEIILQLCFTEHQRVKEMMVDILIDRGQENRLEVEGILQVLATSTEKGGLLRNIRQFFGRSVKNSDVSSQNARKIAIEVASHLGITLDIAYDDTLGRSDE